MRGRHVEIRCHVSSNSIVYLLFCDMQSQSNSCIITLFCRFHRMEISEAKTRGIGY